MSNCDCHVGEVLSKWLTCSLPTRAPPLRWSSSTTSGSAALALSRPLQEGYGCCRPFHSSPPPGRSARLEKRCTPSAHNRKFRGRCIGNSSRGISRTWRWMYWLSRIRLIIVELNRPQVVRVSAGDPGHQLGDEVQVARRREYVLVEVLPQVPDDIRFARIAAPQPRPEIEILRRAIVLEGRSKTAAPRGRINDQDQSVGGRL